MILNIHSLATRRSMGILFEGVVTQLAVNEVKIVDATAFQDGISLVD